MSTVGGLYLWCVQLDVDVFASLSLSNSVTPIPASRSESVSNECQPPATLRGMNVLQVAQVHTPTLFTLTNGLRAIQLVDRNGDTIYANTRIEPGDHVLVAEVPGQLRSPSMEDPTDSVSHIIVGLLPPSKWDRMPSYQSLVDSSN